MLRPSWKAGLFADITGEQHHPTLDSCQPPPLCCSAWLDLITARLPIAAGALFIYRFFQNELGICGSICELAD